MKINGGQCPAWYMPNSNGDGYYRYEMTKADRAALTTVIAQRVGWDRGLTVFKARVAELRPVYLPPDPAGRTTYEAGELAQFDFWFPAIELPVGYGQTRTAKRLPVRNDIIFPTPKDSRLQAEPAKARATTLAQHQPQTNDAGSARCPPPSIPTAWPPLPALQPEA